MLHGRQEQKIFLKIFLTLTELCCYVSFIRIAEKYSLLIKLMATAHEASHTNSEIQCIARHPAGLLARHTVIDVTICLCLQLSGRSRETAVPSSRVGRLINYSGRFS